MPAARYFSTWNVSRKKAAVVAIHRGLDDHDARDLGLDEAQAHESSPLAMRRR
jgi:hypothetical protein